MKAKAVKGKTVLKVHQTTATWNAGRITTINSIEFTDGTFLLFHVVEGEGEYGVEPTFFVPRKAVAS